MKASRNLKTTITLIILISSSLAAPPFCSENCVSCENPQKCSICLNYKINVQTKKCISTPAPDYENCRAWSYFIGTPICAMCKENYSLDLGRTGKCVKTSKYLGEGVFLLLF